MAADDIDIYIDIAAGPAELDALEPLWIALHRHRTVVPSTAMLIDDDSVCWSRRRAL